MATEEEFRVFGQHLRAVLQGLLGGLAAPAAAAAADPFPSGGVDAFTSHFVFTTQFLGGNLAGQPLSTSLPTSIQTVGRSDPFIYQGPEANHSVTTPLPAGCTLSPTITEKDFPERPADFFEVGKQTVWMQIVNLDASGDTPYGPVRIILGETLKREYPDMFQPSLGAAQSIAGNGFPAKLFFDPTAVMETPLGAFVAVHGVLAYGRVFEFPPLGSPVTIRKLIPLHTVAELRAATDRATVAAQAQIIALSHNIDSNVQLAADEAFNLVETSVRAAQG
jgi:hypothetical protein